MPSFEHDGAAAGLKPPTHGLRLVAGIASRKERLLREFESPTVPCLVLKSAMGEKDIVGSSELTALFQTLMPGERVEFVHTLHRDKSGNALEHLPYRLQVRVAPVGGRVDELKGRVAGVVASAYPTIHFEADEAPPSGDLSHVAQFVPAGVRVAAKPGPGVGSTLAASSATTLWPYPNSLTERPFRTPLTQPLDLPLSTEITIRIHGFSLDDHQCAALHRTLMRLQGDSLATFHPHSPITAFSASSDLKDAAIPLIRHWLRHPAGWAVDCIVRSSEPLGPVARQLIPAEVFGTRPFTQIRSFDSSFVQPLAQPELAWAIAEGQGIPPLMPANSVLNTLAVAKHFAAPVASPPREGSWLGETVCGRRSGPVFLPFESRSRHVGLFGATGAGKSSLLTQMMASDIADPARRCGLGLIDPHGSLYQRVLELIPHERADDVILIDTADLSVTACLNPLEGLKDDPLQASFVVSEIMSLIDMLFESKDTSGPMLRTNLRNLLLLTAAVPAREPCLLDAMRILEDTDYAEYLLSKCKDRNAVEYWRKFMRTQGSENGYASWGPYLMARLTPFISSPIMKRLISRPNNTIDLAKAMQEKKIVLFNLNKGVLQDIEVQVLGSLILTKFFSAALARARIPEAERTPFHLYVDEFQTFATDSVPRMFSEGRKFGLFLTIANQSISQLENRWGRSNIASSVLANTATKFMFRLGPADVSTLEAYYRPQFDAGTMSNLPDFHAVACMTDKNKPLPPFVIKANLAVPDTSCHANPKDLENLSRQRYTVPIERANEELAKLFELDIGTLGSRPSAKDDVQPTVDSQPLVQIRPVARRAQATNGTSGVWQALPAGSNVLNADGGANHSTGAKVSSSTVNA